MIAVKGQKRLGASIAKQVRERLKEGRIVVVFVEGTRTPPPHSTAQPGTRLFVDIARKLGKKVVFVDFGNWYHVWGPPGTLFSAHPEPVTITVSEELPESIRRSLV